MAMPPRFFRRFARVAVVAVLAVCIVSLGAIALVGGTQVGQAWLSGQAADRLEAEFGHRVELRKLRIDWLSGLSIERLEIADASGSWLEAEDTVLRWRLGDLLDGVVGVDLLRIARLRLARRPTFPAIEESDAGGGDAWFPAVVVRGIELPELVLGAEIAVRETKLDARFELRASTKTGVDAEFRLASPVGEALNVEGRLALSPLSELDLDLEVAAGERGLLGRLLGRPDLPRLDVKVAGRGPLTAWQGEARGTLAGTASFTAGAAGDLVGGRDFDLELEARPEAGFVNVVGFAVPDAVTASATLRRDGEDVFHLRHLIASSGGSKLEGEGRLRLSGVAEAMSTSGRLSRRDLRPFLPLDMDLEAVAIEGTLDGSLISPSLSLAMRVVRPRMADLGAAALACGLVGETLDLLRPKLTGHCAVEAPELPVDLARALGTAPGIEFAVSVDSPADRLDVPKLRLVGTPVMAEVNATVAGLFAGDTPNLSGAVSFALPDVGLVAPAAADFARGRLTGRFDVAGDPIRGFRGHVEAATPDFTLLGRDGAGPRASPWQLQADASWSADEGVGLERIAGSTSWARLEGRGQFRPGEASASMQAELEIADLSRVPHELAARLSGGGQLEIVADVGAALQLFDVVLTTTDVVVDGSALPGLKAAIRGSVESGDVLRLDDVQFRLAGLVANGEVVGRLGRQEWRGHLEMAPQALPDGLRIVGRSLSGAAALSVRLAPVGGDQQLSWQAAVTDGRLGAGAGRVAAAKLESRGRVSALFADPGIEASLTLDGLVSEQLGSASARAEVAGSIRDLGLELRAEGDIGRPVQVSLTGRGGIRDAAPFLDLGALAVDVAGERVILEEPARFSLRDGILRASWLSLGLGGGRIAVEGHIGPRTVESKLRVEALPLASLARILGAPSIEGVADGVVELGWRPERRAMNGRMMIGGLRLPGLAADITPGRLDMQTGWDGSVLQAEGTLSGLTETPARATLSIPLAGGSRPFEIDATGGTALGGVLDWRGELATIATLLLLPGHELGGDMVIAVTLGGMLGQPTIEGKLGLTDGRYEHLVYGTLFRDIKLGARGSKAGDLALSGMGTDGDKGRFDLSGRFGLGASGVPEAEAKLRLESLRVLRRDDLRVVASSDLGLRLAGQEAVLAGRLRAERVDLQIGGALPVNITELKVREIGAGREAEEADQAPAIAPSRIQLDLDVELPGMVFVSGRGLTSEWRGGLRITGSSDAPIVSGRLEVVRGNIDLAGRKFEIATGRLDFDGGPEVDPTLDIRVQHESAAIRAEIRLGGRLSAPDLQVTSTPPLPRDEAIARILFGTSIIQLSPFQALGMARAVAVLTGTDPGGGGGIVDDFRDKLGLDSITVDADGTAPPKVGVGKYVLDNVYLGVKKGAGSSDGEAEAVVDVTPNLSVRSTLGAHSEANVGVDWKLDY